MAKAEFNSMKILFFIDSLRSGGKERRFIELIKAFPAKIQFEIVLMSKEVHYKEVFRINTRIHYIIRKRKKDISAFYKFYKICKNYKPDIVHCWDSMTAIYSIPSCKLLNIKFVNGMIVDAPSKQNIFNKYWLRGKLTFPFSNIILSNSKAGLAAYHAPKKKRFFIYNGFNFKRANNITDREQIRSLLKIDTRYVIGMVASLSKFKDYKTFFGAAQLLLSQRDDVTFLAIGSETDSVLARNLFDKIYTNCFRLLGKQTDIESLINAIDIGVMATYTEGISNSIMEYMALGKPVIATDGGGTCEIVKDGETGFLVKTSNVEDLTNKMELLLNDAKLRSTMGMAGKQRIYNSFSIDIMVEKHILVYENVLNYKRLKEHKRRLRK
jgi:glycosyltransferase involved in cell wall biosynthesis